MQNRNTQLDKAKLQQEMERRILGIDPPPIEDNPGEQFWEYKRRVREEQKERKGKKK